MCPPAWFRRQYIALMLKPVGSTHVYGDDDVGVEDKASVLVVLEREVALQWE